MRYAWLGFHIIMLLLVIVAVGGGFSPPKTGSMMQDNGSTIMPTIGLLFIWFVGAIVFRVVRRFKNY
jgi:hypothetical protein